MIIFYHFQFVTYPTCNKNIFGDKGVCILSHILYVPVNWWSWLWLYITDNRLAASTAGIMGHKYKDSRSVAFYIIYIFVVQWFLAVSSKQSIYYGLSLSPSQASHVLKHFPPFSFPAVYGKACISRRFVWGFEQTLETPQLDLKLSWSLIRDQWANAHNQQKVLPTRGTNGSGGRRRF